MKSFVIALLIFAFIGVGACFFCSLQEKTIDMLLNQTERLVEDKSDFSKEQNLNLTQEVQVLWQERLWLLELAVEEEYLAPITENFLDMSAGSKSGDLSRYLSGKDGAKEGLLKLKSINKISLSQIF